MSNSRSRFDKLTTGRSLFLVLHNIRSAYNVGSIFRTADGAGVEKVFCCGYTPVPKAISNFQFSISNQFPKSKFSNTETKDKISKTALGAENYVSWEHHRQTWRLLKKLKKEGVLILALERAKKSKNIFHYKLPRRYKKIALVVGNEVHGLSGQILKYGDQIVEIPMHGQKESLNVSVATGIALYQILKI